MSLNFESWPRPHRLTVDEYYRMVEVGLLTPDDRVELIEGEIVDMPPIGSRHAAMVNSLAERLIRAMNGAAGVGIQAPVRLSSRSEPQPDLALLKGGTGAYKNAHPTAADVLLLIEVSESTLRYDLSVKSRLYAKHGIPEYWVVDLVDNRIHRRWNPRGEEYTDYATVSSGAVRCESLGCAIDLHALF
jgi:Uma2 family endonuclease